MLAGSLDHFCLKNQWKINVFGPNIGLGVAEVSRPGWLAWQAWLARLDGLSHGWLTWQAWLAGLDGCVPGYQPGWPAWLADCQIARLPDCTIA